MIAGRATFRGAGIPLAKTWVNLNEPGEEANI